MDRLPSSARGFSQSLRFRRDARQALVMTYSLFENPLTPARRSSISGLLNKRNRVFGEALNDGEASGCDVEVLATGRVQWPEPLRTVAEPR